MSTPLQEVEQFLNDVVLDVSKAALRSPQLDDMHESDAEIYLFLYVYFKKASIKQRKEDTIAVTRDAVSFVLQNVLAKNIAIGAAQSKKSLQAPQPEQYCQTNDSPVMQQRTLREVLIGAKINVSAFSEVVEMCRFVDNAQKCQTPFGAVNLYHFVAVFITLQPTHRLFDLVVTVWEAADIPEHIKLKIFFVWSIVDAQNREALRDLCKACSERPGMSTAMMLEFHPAVESIGTAKYSTHTAVGGRTTVAPRTVVHDENEEGVAALAIQPNAGAVVARHNDDDDSDDDGRTAEDKAFWADLVS